MLSIVFSLLPIFLLILLGVCVNHFKVASSEQLMGLEKLTFYIFFPALLVQTLYKADFQAISAGSTALAFFLGIATMMLIGLTTRHFAQRAMGISNPSYSSVFQGFTRWNAFIALAVVDTFDDPIAVTIVTIGIGIMVIPSNLVNIIVVAWLGNGSLSKARMIKLVVLNPFIIAVILGLILSLTGIKLGQPIETALSLVARTALPIGLILVGAGLTLKMPKSSFVAASYAGIMKLITAPFVYVGVAMATGVQPEHLLPVAICAAVPSAMNGYLIAKELGGDAPLYAAIATFQTAAAMITLPLVIILIPYFAG